LEADGKSSVNLILCASDWMKSCGGCRVGEVEVKFESKRNHKVMLEIYELNGRKVVTLFDSRAQADVIYNIDYSAIGLESGVYSARLTSSTEQVVQKLIVTK